VPSLYEAKTNGTLAHKFVNFSHCDLASTSGIVPSGRDSYSWGINCTFLDLGDSFTANPAVRSEWESEDVPSVDRTGQ
jgi:hypothetical protein